MLPDTPLILSIGGLDPSGSAGVLADARMIEHLGGRSACLITAHTAQGRVRHRGQWAVELAQLRQQWRCLDHAQIAGIKIGVIANPAQAAWLAQLLPGLGVPVVFDPVLSSSQGGLLGVAAAARQLLPAVSLITPNAQEAVTLGPALRAADATLVTTTDATPEHTMIQHQLSMQGDTLRLQTPRRPGRYRGTGCLLASAICTHLVGDASLPQACRLGIDEVDRWLLNALRFDDGVHLPRPPA